MAKYIVTGDDRDKIDRKMDEIKRQLRQKNGCPINPDLVQQTLQRMIEGKFEFPARERVNCCSAFVTQINQGHRVVIPACGGSETIVGATELFAAGIVNYLNGHRLPYLQNFINPTVETDVRVYVCIKDGHPKEQFGSFGMDVERFCFTQHQIKKFAEVHRAWLAPEGEENFFLLATGKDILMVSLRTPAAGFLAEFKEFFENNTSYGYTRGQRLFVPESAFQF